MKVLDFGLAKAVDVRRRRAVDVADAHARWRDTGGFILGTAAYMSPEQARGAARDKRTDIWAFGCVLYEMLAGRRAFEGEDATDTIAAVVRGEPDWSALPRDLPGRHFIATILKRCLQKDRRARISDIGVARFLLEHGAQVSPAAGETHARGAGRRRVLVWSTLALAAGIALTAGGGPAVFSRAGTCTTRRHQFFDHTVRTSAYHTGDAIGTSPSRLTAGSSRTCWGPLLARTERSQAAPAKVSELGTKSLATGTSVRAPFFSADNQWVGYFASDGLRKVSIDGGPSTLVCGTVSAPRGASWGPDDTIFFSTSDPASGLLSVSANGGEPTIPDHC